jgi:S1-C subfamily serine protease
MSRHLPAAIAALAFLAAPATAQRPEPDAPRGEAAPRRGGDDLRRNPIVRAVEQIGPSVVNISAERLVMRRASPLDYFGAPGDRGRRSESLGSGVVLDGSGIVVTNDHVISGASKIIVTTADGRELEAELLGADADNDLAVLKVDGKGLKPVRVGTTADLMIGETAIAVGNPFGLSNTVTTGIVSALQRTVKGEGRTYTDFIQTDAAINPGNSGGALCNVLGELIGINTAIVGGANTIGFAIPVERVRRIADDLLRFGEVKPVWIGVRGTTLTAGRARPSARGLGMRVRSVYPSSPADVAPREPGDVVLSLNGRDVESREDFDTLLSAVAPGGSVTLRSGAASGPAPSPCRRHACRRTSGWRSSGARSASRWRRSGGGSPSPRSRATLRPTGRVWSGATRFSG